MEEKGKDEMNALDYSGPRGRVIFDGTEPFWVRFKNAVSRGWRGMRSGYKAVNVKENARRQRIANFAPACPLCSAAMEKDVEHGNYAGFLVLRLMAFAVGIAITILIPIAGWVIGPAICIGAFFIDSSRKVWKCKQCASVTPRG